MGYITETSTVCGCNCLFGEETRHPLVGVVSADGQDEVFRCSDCYSVMMASFPDGSRHLGRMRCDFSYATMQFRRPGKTVSTKNADKAAILLFHPAIISCTPLGLAFGRHTFFGYAGDEALHLSFHEAETAQRCIDGVKSELRHGVDEFSKTLICNHIETLLNYSERFYARQFITRHEVNTALISRIDKAIDEYMAAGRAATGTMPTAQDMAPGLKVSAAYLDDLLRHETGKHTADYVSLHRIKTAKTMLMDHGLTTAEISAALGFCSESCFNAFFKKITGHEPEEYRKT